MQINLHVLSTMVSSSFFPESQLIPWLALNTTAFLSDLDGHMHVCSCSLHTSHALYTHLRDTQTCRLCMQACSFVFLSCEDRRSETGKGREEGSVERSIKISGEKCQVWPPDGAPNTPQTQRGVANSVRARDQPMRDLAERLGAADLLRY